MTKYITTAEKHSQYCNLDMLCCFDDLRPHIYLMMLATSQDCILDWLHLIKCNQVTFMSTQGHKFY